MNRFRRFAASDPGLILGCALFAAAVWCFLFWMHKVFQVSGSG